jgi:hypothetical protein
MADLEVMSVLRVIGKKLSSEFVGEEIHHGLGKWAGSLVTYFVFFDQADRHNLHDAVGDENFIGGKDLINVRRLDTERDVIGAGQFKNCGADDAGEDVAFGIGAGGGDGGIAEVIGRGRGEEGVVFDGKDVGDAGGLEVVVGVEPECLARTAADGFAEGGVAGEVIEGFVAGLDVEGVEFLLVVEHDRHALSVVVGRVRLELGGGEEAVGDEVSAMEGVLHGLPSRNGKAEAGVGEIVAGEKFIDGGGEVGIREEERNEERLGTVAKTLKMLREAEDPAILRAHGGKDSGAVEQAGVAEGEIGRVFVDEVAVEPGDGHRLSLG